MDVRLRPIGEDEREQLRDMARRYWLELMPHWRGNRDSEYQAAYFADRFRIGWKGTEHWWAEADGGRIGFARVEMSTDLDGLWAQVHDFYVEADVRRRGRGRAFSAAVVAELRRRGCRRIDLNVRADNPGALAFWRSVGFELAGHRMRVYLDG